MNAALTVVVPTFNRVDLLRECLQSIREQSMRPAETIVVDDGSTEDVAGFISREFSEVRLVRMDKNGGFCRAANAGFRAATSEFIFLLNNDMTLDHDCIEHLMRGADARTLRTPLVLFKSDPDTIYCAGDRILTNGRPEPIGFRKPLAGSTMPARVFGVTFGAALIPHAALRRVGYLDEKFVAYFEDADFCMRARWAGLDCMLVPEAVAYHVGSASLGGKTSRRSMLCYRNHALLVAKNFPLAVILRFLPALVLERWHQAGMMLSSARAERGAIGALAVLLAGTNSLLATMAHAIRGRSHLRSRAITNREFIALLTRPDERQ
ncbi:MAG: glycosyltransferase family 2 protein [Candidatus Hydrogenedentes bacterium]|nr:glycosyltransferase family 2 protein [Candidatus Hydrogenedentota bacterium]